MTEAADPPFDGDFDGDFDSSQRIPGADSYRFVVGLGNPGEEYRNHRHNIGFQVVDLLTETLRIDESLRPDPRGGCAPRLDADLDADRSVLRVGYDPDLPPIDSKGVGRAARDGDGLENGLGDGLGDGVSPAAEKSGGALSPRVFCLEPGTYMNRSGEPTAAMLRAYGGAPEQVLVVYDDLDLPLGRLRFRRGDSCGDSPKARARKPSSSAGHRGIESLLRQIGGGFDRLRIGIGRPRHEDDGDFEADRAVIEHVLGDFESAELGPVDWARTTAVAAIRCWIQRGVMAAMNEFNGLRYEEPCSSAESPSQVETPAMREGDGE